MTLLLNKAAHQAPNVGFVHTCPGVVESGIMRDMEPSLRLRIIVAITGFLAPLINTSPDECGERQLLAATSARFGAREGHGEGLGLSPGMSVARGINGQPCGGVYSLDTNGESSPSNVNQFLKGYIDDGTAEQVWDYVMTDFENVVGSQAMA